MGEVTKLSYSIAIRLWINHKQVIQKTSPHPHYKNLLFVKSMGRCFDLMKMVKRSCEEYDMNKLCYMVIINQDHLKNILPATNNTSYKTQFEKLERIIEIAKTYKK